MSRGLCQDDVQNDYKGTSQKGHGVKNRREKKKDLFRDAIKLVEKLEQWNLENEVEKEGGEKEMGCKILEEVWGGEGKVQNLKCREKEEEKERRNRKKNCGTWGMIFWSSWKRGIGGRSRDRNVNGVSDSTAGRQRGTKEKEDDESRGYEDGEERE
jgi:hypothetical protein